MNVRLEIPFATLQEGRQLFITFQKHVCKGRKFLVTRRFRIDALATRDQVGSRWVDLVDSSSRPSTIFATPERQLERMLFHKKKRGLTSRIHQSPLRPDRRLCVKRKWTKIFVDFGRFQLDAQRSATTRSVRDRDLEDSSSRPPSCTLLQKMYDISNRPDRVAGGKKCLGNTVKQWVGLTWLGLRGLLVLSCRPALALRKTCEKRLNKFPEKWNARIYPFNSFFFMEKFSVSVRDSDRFISQN